MNAENNKEENLDEKSDLNKFTKLCAELESALANAYGSLDDILDLKDLLLEQSIPCSVKVKLTLTLGRLHRSMSDLSVPTGEITRLVRLYAVPWENKSKALKKLHQDYESKQHQLDIALKRLEMVGVHSMRMEKEKRVMNWEKLFAKLVGSKGHGQRWKFLIQQFKNKIKRGENIANLYSLASDDDEDDDEIDAKNFQNGSRVPFSRTFSERLKTFEGFPMKDTLPVQQKSEEMGRQHSLIEEESEASIALPISDTNSVVSLEQDSVSVSSSQVQKRVRFDDDDDDQEYTRDDESYKKASLSSVVETIPLATKRNVIMAEKECWTHEPDIEKMFHIRVFKPTCKTVSFPWCSISFDKQLRKTLVFKDVTLEETANEKSTRKLSGRKSPFSGQDKKGKAEDNNVSMKDNYQEFVFKLSSEFDERNHDEILIKMSVHPENKKNMIAMTSLKLTDLTIVEEDQLKELKPTAYQLRSMVNNSELTFNKPCGDLHIICFYSSVSLPRVVNRGTETLSIEELTDRIIALRKNEFLKRLKSAGTTMTEKPIYTEDQMSTAKETLRNELLNLREEYEERLGLMISQLNKENLEDVREFVNAATSPLFMWSSSYNENDFKNAESFSGTPFEPEKPTKKEIKKHPKKISRQKNDHIWGENLPTDFYERMEMFQEASVKHHQQLKDKFYETREKEIEKKLAIQNRLDNASNASTAIPKEVCLPALFMPSKTNNIYSSKARSYFHAFGTYEDRLTQPPSIIQLPRLRNTQDSSETVGIYESVSSRERRSLIRNDTADDNQLDRFSDDSSVTIDVCGVDNTNDFNEDESNEDSQDFL